MQSNVEATMASNQQRLKQDYDRQVKALLNLQYIDLALIDLPLR